MKYIPVAVWFVMFNFFVGGAGALAEEVALVRSGTAVGAIVVPDTASEQLQRSAEFLRDYVAKSTGAVLPIQETAGDLPAIHLGATSLIPKHDLEGLGRSGFVAKRVGEKVFVITGETDWGTEFGMYDFLERHLGVRWLAPTELFTEVPKHETVLLPKGDLREEPVFLAREFFPLEVDNEPKDAARSEGPLWYRQADMWGRANRLLADVVFHHYLKDMLPPSKFGASNPEFYPMLEGKRMVPPDDVHEQWQPNFSAPGIAEASANEIIRYFDENPDKNSYSLGINDSYRFDESEASKARRSGRKNSINLEDISDDYYRWANDVAELVGKKHPDKVLGLLAYLQVLEPPTQCEVNPAIVPFITYENTRWEDPVYREAMQKLTLAWGEEVPVLGWYDYVYGSRYLIPRFFPNAEQKSLIWGAENKVKYYYAEAMPNWGEGPNLWVLTKLLWNPRQDVNKLLDDWYVNAVGAAAAPKLRAYYEIWEKFWEKDILSSPWYSALILWADFDSTNYLLAVPDEYLTRSDALMDEAVELAGTPVQKERAETLRKMWKIYQASVIARKADEIWKTADLQNEAQVKAYMEQCKVGIKTAQERLRLLSASSRDPVLGHSVFRYTSSWMLGDDWGANALWPLLPWVKKNVEVRKFLEELAAQSGDDQVLGTGLTYEGGSVPLIHEGPKVAAEILAVSEGKVAQLLPNGSFEEGMSKWSNGPYEVSEDEALDGKASLRIATTDSSVLVQDIPYRTGSYVAKMSAKASKGFTGGKVQLFLTAMNDEGTQIGIALPTAEVLLHPGEWSTLVLPFSLGSFSLVPTILKVEVKFEGLAEGSAVYLDDLGIYRVDDAAKETAGAGPDGN